MRSLSLFLLVLALSGCQAAGEPPRAIPTHRPNILLLTAEDLSPRIGSFGDPVARTPNLDRLASQGTRYPNTFTTSGVCAPSRAALMTGVRQTAVGGHHMRSGRFHGFRAVPPPEVKAFPELLRAAGYFTFTTQKLDYQFSGTSPGSGPFTIWDRETIGYADWRGAPDGKPFYGQINYGITHESGIFPVTWPRSVTHAVMMVLRWSQSDGPGERPDPKTIDLPPYYPDTPTVRNDIAQHYENVNIMDRQVGETLEALERDGLADSTIVIWTTDHGDGLPRAKRELFDSGLKVPMIIRWPKAFRPAGLAPGAVEERLISFADLAPTILAMAGVDPPAWMDGEVFAGELDSSPRRYVYASRDRLDEWPDRQRAVRDERYKYIRNYDPGTPGARPLAFRDNQDIMLELWRLQEAGELDAAQQKWFDPRPVDELYDTWNDPHEVENLAGQAEYAKTLARLRGALDTWMAERPDLGAIPEEDMIESYWPGGEQPQTAAPEIDLSEEPEGKIRVTLSSPTPGSSIGYRVRDEDGVFGPWELYLHPIAVNGGQTLETKAVRYGWSESDVQSARLG